MGWVILPFASQMTARHIHEIAEATLGNSDIREAAATRPVGRLDLDPGACLLGGTFLLVYVPEGDQRNYFLRDERALSGACLH